MIVQKQKFSVFELSWSMLVIHHKSYQSSKRSHQYGECHSGRIMDGFWLNCRFKIVDFWFSIKFHRSGLARIFSFLTIMEHVSYPPKKFSIKQKTSSRWWMSLWKDYGWFLKELSIFDFQSNCTGLELQEFSGFELSWSMLVIHHKGS